MAVEVRPATPADVAGIRSVATRAWHAAHEPIVGAAAVEEFLAEYYDAGTLAAAVAEDRTVLEVAVDPGWTPPEADPGEATDGGGRRRGDGDVRGGDARDAGGHGAGAADGGDGDARGDRGGGGETDASADGDAPPVVGFAMATPGEGGVYHLGRIYVDPGRWGEGVGRRLLDRVESRVRGRGGTRIELAVMAENDRAVGFYEAAGYDRVGTFHDDRLDVRSHDYAKSLSP